VTRQLSEWRARDKVEIIVVLAVAAINLKSREGEMDENDMLIAAPPFIFGKAPMPPNTIAPAPFPGDIASIHFVSGSACRSVVSLLPAAQIFQSL
jgi:hypothetical protein